MRFDTQRITGVSPILISCAQTKATRPTEARHLYAASDWFRKASEYCELSGRPWYILSALHGLVQPNQRIGPYNYSLPTGQAGATTRYAWARGIVDALPPGRNQVITILAGERYRVELLPMLEAAGWRPETPLEGLGIGQQKRRLLEMTGQLLHARIIAPNLPSSQVKL